MRLGYGFDGQCLRQDDAELPLASRSVLEQNYRSNAVAAWNAVIERNTLREQKQAVSVSGGGEPIRVVECQCELTEAEFVLAQIRREVSEKGLKLNEIAILYRKTFTGKFFQQKLLEAAIPFNHHGVSFYRRKMVRAVIALLRIAANNSDDSAFEKAFVPLVEGEGATAEEAKKILERVRVVASMNGNRLYMQARQLLHQKMSGSLTKNMLAQGKKALKIIHLVSSRVKNQGDNLKGLLEFAASTSKSKERFLTPLDKLGASGAGQEGVLLNDNREPRTSMQVLFDDVELFHTRERTAVGLDDEEEDETMGEMEDDGGSGSGKSESGTHAAVRRLYRRCEEGNEGDAGSNDERPLSTEEQLTRIRRFLDFLAELEEEQATKIKSDNENAVSLLTIHRSKGLEWKSVFVIKMNEGEVRAQIMQHTICLCFFCWQLTTCACLSFRVLLTKQNSNLQTSPNSFRRSAGSALSLSPALPPAFSCPTDSRGTNAARSSCPLGTSAIFLLCT